MLTIHPLSLAVAEQPVLDLLHPDDYGYVRNKPAISPELDEFVKRLMKTGNILGLSLGVVHADTIELGAWGVINEDGDEMTSDASTLHILEFIHDNTDGNRLIHRPCFRSLHALKRFSRPLSGSSWTTSRMNGMLHRFHLMSMCSIGSPPYKPCFRMTGSSWTSGRVPKRIYAMFCPTKAACPGSSDASPWIQMNNIDEFDLAGTSSRTSGLTSLSMLSGV